MGKGKNRNTTKKQQAKKQKRKQIAKNRVRAIADSHKQISSHERYAFDLKKLSSVLLEYAQPLLEGAEDREQEYEAVLISIIFWNASIVSADEEDAEKKMQLLLEAQHDTAIPDDISEQFSAIFQMMYARKKLFFADENRVILDYDIRIDDDEIYLQLKSMNTD